MLLAAFSLAPLAGYAHTTAQKIQQAKVYFERATKAHEALLEKPAAKRTQKEYEGVIRAFRRVYYAAPTYQNNAKSLTVMGEVYEEMARQLDNNKYFHSAIGAYEYLLQEYPHSRYRYNALLTIGRIYREELGQPEEALQPFELYLKKYPRHRLVQQARKAVRAIKQGLAAREQAVSEARSFTSGSSRRTSSSGRPLVTNIRHWATPDYTRVVIDVEEEVKYRIGRLSNPDRIYFDLQNTEIDPAVSGKSFPVKYGLLKQIRIAPNRTGVSRVVLDLGNITDYTVFELPNPYRLVIDIHGEGGQGNELADAQAQRPLAGQGGNARSDGAASLKETQEELSASAAEPAFGKIHTAQPNGDGSHSLIRALGLKIGRITIDPGHGGRDTGTIGPSGLLEKDLVLDVARRLGPLIVERLGSEVVYTRQDDSFVPLETRTAIANEKRSDLFISIHVNSSRSRSARGIETYYLNFTTDAEALEVAARENAVSQESIYQLQDLVQKIAQQEKMGESKEFAARIQSALWKNIGNGARPMKNRGVKKAPFVVLIGANMPSVLTEVSFLSNPQDEKLLRTDEHRQKIAEALYAGIEEYVDSLSGVKVARSEDSPSLAAR
ncbi:MAG: N-acetylmuramoyl-L-alanine amidase [Acidobacteria bacterium]|nr:N-acetylmuramoyl-L-alanine amidase [Acidobacteriota bacterium]